jgi:hypothetical protein
VERWQRDRILAEQRGRGENVRDGFERRYLERELEFNSLKGRPIRQRLRNATPAADSYIVSLGGPLPYMQRLRLIEDEAEEHERALEAAWRELAALHASDGERFAAAWRRAAGRWPFAGVNDLIDRHNRYFPTEARLPMDPRTGDFALVNGRRYELEPLDAEWVLERFPPRIDVALQADAA